jgi:hypothetical protein
MTEPHATGASRWYLRIASIGFVCALSIYAPLALLVAGIWGWSGQLEYLLGKRMFLDVGLFFIPALTVFGFLDGVGWNRFGKAAIFASLGALGLVASAGLAIAIYPKYPSVGPHELVACSFVLPALLLPGAALALPAPVAISKRAVLMAMAGALVVVGCTAYAFGNAVELALPIHFHGIERSRILRHSGFFELFDPRFKCHS